MYIRLGKIEGRLFMTAVNNGFWPTAWRYTQAMPGFIFGTEADRMGRLLQNSYKTQKFNGFGKQIADAFESSVLNHESKVAKNGGFFKNMWKDFTTTFTDMPKYWKAGAKVADKAGKTGLAKFWKQMVGVGKLLGKRMPLIGAVLILATEFPNIAKATWNDGLLAGAGETAKTGVRLALGAIGGAIGSVVPIPLVGTLVGYAVGDMVGRLIVGKSYSEKQEQGKNEKLAEATTDFKIDTNSIPYGGLTGTNNDEFMKLQQAYMQSAGVNNPFGSYTGQTGQNVSTLA